MKVVLRKTYSSDRVNDSKDNAGNGGDDGGDTATDGRDDRALVKKGQPHGLVKDEIEETHHDEFVKG